MTDRIRASGRRYVPYVERVCKAVLSDINYISLSVRAVDANASTDRVAQFKRDRTRRVVESTILFSYAALSVDSRFFFDDMCMMGSSFFFRLSFSDRDFLRNSWYVIA